MKRIYDLDGTLFVNAPAAIMAMQAAQIYFALAGFYTSSSINPDSGRVELTVHFDLPNYPKLPNGYKYSRREVETSTYWSDTFKEIVTVRTIDYYFKY